MVDQTGLTGKFDFCIRHTYDEVHSADPNAPPGLFTAVQEQLGLKFEPVKATTKVFVLGSSCLDYDQSMGGDDPPVKTPNANPIDGIGDRELHNCPLGKRAVFWSGGFL